MYNPTTEEQAARAFDAVIHNIGGVFASWFHYVITHPAALVAVLICIALLVLWLIVYVRVTHAVVHVCKYIIKKLDK